MLINLTLQVALLLVVSMNMLENPFPDTKVQEMINWRVANGHTDFDESTARIACFKSLNLRARVALWHL